MPPLSISELTILGIILAGIAIYFIIFLSKKKNRSTSPTPKQESKSRRSASSAPAPTSPPPAKKSDSSEETEAVPPPAPQPSPAPAERSEPEKIETLTGGAVPSEEDTEGSDFTIFSSEDEKAKEFEKEAFDLPGASDETSLVDFAIFAPGQLPRGTTQLVDLWAYKSEQFKKVREMANEMGQTDLSGRKTGVPIADNSRLVIQFSIPSLGVCNQIDEIYWRGEPANASFPVAVPADAHSGSHSGEAGVYIYGARVARIRFSVQVGEAVTLSPDLAKIATDISRIDRAFASYAAEDRSEVLGRIQGMKTVFPDLDIFIDALSLQAGDDWNERLIKELVERDVLFLFWSEHAAASEYVEKEWRTALEKRGLHYIDPVPLQIPSVAPPPADLSGLHFADAYATYAYLSKEKSD